MTDIFLHSPMLLLSLLIGIAILIYQLSSIPTFSTVFKYAPVVVWLYFLPMLMSSFDVIPSSSDLYRALATYLLPMALFLLTISTNVKAIMRIGLAGLGMLIIGTLGICLGAVIAMLVFQHWLPEDSWQSLSMLSATWIGGSANMLAMQQILDVKPENVGSVVIVDTLVSYSWLGIVIALSAKKDFFDKILGASNDSIDAYTRIIKVSEETSITLSVANIITIIGSALIVATLFIVFGKYLETLLDLAFLSEKSLTILLVVTFGLGLSFTPLGEQARALGTDNFAYAGLFILFMTVGAQANLTALLNAPVLLIAGISMVLIHIFSLIVAAKIFKLPSFFIAVGSLANIGGAVSAPIGATAFNPSLAPIGALLGVAGYIVGIYVPVLLSAVLRAMAG